MLSFTDAPVSSGDLEIGYRGLETGHTKYDLALYAQEQGGRIYLQLAYQAELFEAATAERLLRNFVVLLDSILETPDAPTAELNCLGAEEARAVIADFNHTERPYPLDDTVAEAFERQAAASPDAPAYLCQGRSLAFGEVNARANRLARHLLARGVRPGARVAVCLDRSFDLVIALLAVLKAGGTYVGLDPEHPALRRQALLEQARADALVCDAGHDDVTAFGGEKIVVDVERRAIAERSGANLASARSPAGLLALVFTSASTGAPKGVPIAERAAMNRLNWMWETHPFQPGEVALLQKPSSLVAGFWEAFGALLRGYPTVILTREEVLDPRLRWRRIVESRVTRMAASPAFLAGVLDEAEREGGTRGHLRLVTTSAEPLPAAMVRRWRRVFPGVTLLNLYGASECSSNATAYDTAALPEAAARVPVGRAIANTRAYVLDAQQRPVPLGVTGELCIAGACLAPGYLDRPELTRDRFVPNPFAREPYATLYRTGDLARVGPDGVIELVGRADWQVKIRGFRVDPGEVESVVEDHPDVRRCAVAPVAMTSEGGPALVAYVEPRQPGRLPALRDFVRRRLPDYMVPARYVRVDALPLTDAGKIDRGRLPRPAEAEEDRARPRVLPRTDVEWMLADVWASFLRTAPVGVDEDFFELGGHSLLATRVVSCLVDLLGIELPLQRFLGAPTVEGLAVAVTEAAGGAVRAAAAAGAYRAFRHAAGSGEPDATGGQGEGAPPLTAEQRRAFAARLRQLGLRADAPARISKRPADGPAPLSHPQQRIWLLQQMEPASPLYNVAKLVRLHGALDVSALERALAELVRRHEILRTTYETRGGLPVQVVQPLRPVALPRADLSALPAAEREVDLRRRASAAGRQPFDLTRDPMLRAWLFRLGADDHALLLGWHHITSDGWSLGVRFRELSEIYGALVAGSPPPPERAGIQYADFATWQRAALTEERLAPHRAYWRDALAGAPDLLALPTDRPRPASQTYRGATLPIRLPAELSARLRDFSRAERLTLYMTLLAGFQCLLRQYAGQDDLVVGSPIANRSHAELEPLIGIFMNLLPIRCRISGEMSVREVLREVETRTHAAYAHQELPFEEIVREVRPERAAAHAPVFQVLFNVLNLPRFDLALPGVDCHVTDVDLELARYDLSLYLDDDADAIGGRVEFNRDLFDAGTVARMMEHLPRILAEMVSDPERTVGELPTLGPEEERTVLGAWNRTAVPRPDGIRLDELVEVHAARAPAAPAIVFRDRRVGYGELWRRTTALAAGLRRAGVRPGEPVGIWLDRSVEMVIAMLAVSRAGCAYVPMDPEFPRARLQGMIDDAGMTTVITPDPSGDGRPTDAVQVVPVETLGFEPGRAAGTGLAAPRAPAGLAYVMFTSRSTGRPKGVAVSHRALVNFLRAMQEHPGLGPQDVVLAHTTLTFDIAQLEILLPLVTGATVILLDREAARDARAIARALEAHGVTLCQATPAVWRLMLDLGWPGKADLRMLIGGEGVPVELARDLARRGAGLWNMYGPTETTVWSTTERMDADVAVVAVGRPIANTAIYVVNRDLQPQAPGVPGEVLIGGVGVAEGYVNRPDETRERFVPDPFGPDPAARAYRTGDRGRFLPDGRLVLLGRSDFQVKVRGFRIELGEIETALARQPGVQQSVAVVWRGAGPGQERLVAYVVLAAPGAAAGARLRDALGELLPRYMVPEAVVPLERLPLTSSGKVDREALARMEPGRSGAPGERAAPSGETERRVAEIIQGVLGVESVGPEDDFFALGGHSIKAVMVLARMADALGVDIGLGAFFEEPTARALAGRVEATRVAALAASRAGAAPDLAGAAPGALSANGAGSPPV